MSAERFRRVAAIFAAASELTADARAAYLADACAGDDALRVEVEGLLQEDEESGGIVPRREIADPDAAAPLTVGRYRILSTLGRGGQGIVYLAEDPRLERRVALKVLTAWTARSASMRARLEREAAAASRIDHPGICAVYEVGDVDGVPYIAMRYVEGEPLSTKLAAWKRDEVSSGAGASSTRGRRRRDLIVEAVRIIEATARALDVAHDAGLIHRDVKPGNIMITGAGDPVLVDFGLVRDDDSEAEPLTRTGDVMGTPAYMAPEQVAGHRERVDRRTDVHALGVTLYECLTLARPFEGSTREQLYHEILTAAPPNPRKLNARVPRDLRVIVETALEKKRDRRYQTAAAFAEDLRRWREHEPIQAKPIGPVRRAAKWARRHPARAAALAAAGMVVAAGVGLIVGQRVARDRAVATYLSDARRSLAEKHYSAALERVTRAREQDASSVVAVELFARIEQERATAADDAKKHEALAAAAGAREEAAEKSRAYSTALRPLGPRRTAVENLRRRCADQYTPRPQHVALASDERALAAEEERVKRLAAESREALERAARHDAPYFGGGPSPETEAAFADFFMGFFRERLAADDAAGAARWAAAVREYDTAGRYEAALLGRGTLKVTVTPGDAEVYLFRYESYETVRTKQNVVPRLVPVPTAGIGRCRPAAWLPDRDFFPGDLCLRVTAVTEGSRAAQSGLRPGDLVIRLNGRPCGDGLFVGGLAASGPAAKVGVKLGDRIESLLDDVVEGVYEWDRVGLLTDAEPPDVALVVNGITVEAPQGLSLEQTFGVEPVTPVAVVRGRAPAAMTVLSLRNGQPIELQIPEGETSGLDVEVTAYPLVLSRGNRIDARKPVTADPGSYLLLVRRAGFEDQRFPVVVPRAGAASAAIGLLRAGTTPPGFVYVPPGPFAYGGDAQFLDSGPETMLELSGFFIARKELTNEEWFEFVNDPKVREFRQANEPETRFLPRGPRVKPPPGTLVKTIDGELVPAFGTEETPVLGISWEDIQAYLAWRNAKAKAQGEPWRYALPTEREWEKAARGVDGRFFPWGDRFDPILATGRLRKEARLYEVPGGFEPRDESPYALLDLGGSRYEWTASAFDPHSPSDNRRVVRGGSWVALKSFPFRSTHRWCEAPDFFDVYHGLRLVSRPPHPPIFRAPTIVEGVVNAAGKNSHPTVTGDGLTMYWASDRPGGLGGLDWWRATRPDRKTAWGNAEPVVALNSAGDDSYGDVRDDDLEFYFTSARPGAPGGYDVYRASRPDTTAPWGAPAVVPALSIPWPEFDVTITSDGLELYLIRGPRLIHRATRADENTTQWSAPTAVSELNQPDAFSGAISADGLSIVFTSQRPGGAGAGDLWMGTRRDRNARFTNIRNLRELNTPDHDFGGQWGADGFSFYVSRSSAAGLQCWVAHRILPLTIVDGAKPLGRGVFSIGVGMSLTVSCRRDPSVDTAFIAASFGRIPPTAVPSFQGKLELDPSRMFLIPRVTTGTVGTIGPHGRYTFPVPLKAPDAVGTSVHFQVAAQDPDGAVYLGNRVEVVIVR